MEQLVLVFGVSMAVILYFDTRSPERVDVYTVGQFVNYERNMYGTVQH